MKTFSELGIEDNIIKALSELNISEPTEIQVKSISVLLKGNIDFIGSAQTGTGKTAAFGLPLLQLIDVNNENLQALILCPTRELGQQIAKQLGLFSKYKPGISIRAVYGGTDIEHQLKELKKPTQIIVATPGRLIDLINRDAISLSNLRYFILDEADEMLNMGFKQDIDFVRELVRHKIVTWLFCVNMRDEILKLVDQYLERDFIQVQADPDNLLNADIEHQYMVCRLDQKREGLKYFLKLNTDKIGIVFCRTKAAAQEIAEYLSNSGFLADELHGDLTQKERDNVMRKFKNKELQVLVATDIAARGLDVEGMHFVVHFHLPEQREYFTHRSGRTGRAGNKGVSLCIVFQKEVKKIVAIANNLGLRFTKIEISAPVESDESPAPSEESDITLKENLPTSPSIQGEMVSFYINMGKANDVNPKNLVEFICSEAGLQKKDFGKVTIEKKRAYFEIHHTCIRKLVSGLNNLFVDGKSLVLTRDEFEKI